MTDQNITEGFASMEGVLEGPIATAWSVLTDFAGWNKFCEAFGYMKPLNDKEGLGMTREFQMVPSNIVYQDELVELDNTNYSLSYNLHTMNPPMPALVSALSTIKLEALSENQTKITWSSVTKTVGLGEEILEKIRGAQRHGYNRHIQSLAAHVAKLQAKGL